jgi:hypothetical protein
VGRVACLVWLVVSTQQVASMAGVFRSDATAILFRTAAEDLTAEFDLYGVFRVRNGWVLAAPLLIAVLVAEKGNRRIHVTDLVTIGLGLWVLIGTAVGLATQKRIVRDEDASAVFTFWIMPRPGLISALPYVVRAACALALVIVLLSRQSELGRWRLLPLGLVAIVMGTFVRTALSHLFLREDWNHSSDASMGLPTLALGLGTLVLTAAVAWGKWPKALLWGVSALGCIGFVSLY